VVNMAVYQAGAASGGGYIRPFQGLSTDVTVINGVITIPTPVPIDSSNSGSTFYCVDTGDSYIWHGNKWYPV
jgi:hypothetical protein